MRSMADLLRAGRFDLLTQAASVWETIGAGAGYIQTHEATKQLSLELRIKAFLKWLHGNSDALPDIEVPVILTKTGFTVSREQLQMEQQLAELFQQIETDASKLHAWADELTETHAAIQQVDQQIDVHLAGLPTDIHPEATATIKELRQAHIDCVVPQPPTTETDSVTNDAEATAKRRTNDFSRRYTTATQPLVARLRELAETRPTHAATFEQLITQAMRRIILTQQFHRTLFLMQETSTVMQARMSTFHRVMTRYNATYPMTERMDLAARLAELAGGLPRAENLGSHSALPTSRLR